MRFLGLLFVVAAALPVLAQPDEVPAGTVLSGGSVIELAVKLAVYQG